MIRSIILLVCVLACMPAHSSPTNLTFEPIVVSGQQAEGFAQGVTYRSVSLGSLNASGDVAFRAFLQGPGVSSANDETLWATANRTPAIVARQGDSAPGLPTSSAFTFLDFPLLSDTGEAAFWGDTYGADGFWTGSAGTLNAVAFEGGPAPIPGTNAVFGSLTNPSMPNLFATPALNGAGQIAFWASFGGVPSYANKGVFSTGGDSLHAVARTNDSAPGAPTNARFTKLGHPYALRPTINDQGYTAFYAETSAASHCGIWSEGANGLNVVAQTNAPVPGTSSDVSFSDFSAPRLNNTGQTAFRATLQGSAVSSDNDSGIWSGDSGSLTTIAREGSQAPGLANGTNFADFADFSYATLINSQGRTAFLSNLTGIDVDMTNNTALFAEFADGLDLVAREGDQAVGAPDGVVFDKFEGYNGWNLALSSLAINANGYVAFNAQLRGTGVNGTNDQAVYACTPNGDLFEVIREGQSLEVAPGDTRIIEQVYGWVGGGGEDGYEGGLNDANQLALQVYFTDDSHGIFTVQIPEPTTVCFLCLGGLMACRRARRRA